MYKKLLKNFLIGAVVSLLFSCSSDQAKISGKFTGLKDKTLILEQITPIKKVVDSVTLGSNGEFKFKYKFNRKEPRFLNLRVDNKLATILIEPGENLKLNAIYDITQTLQVEGSVGTDLLSELNKSMASTFTKIDSLNNILARATDTEVRNQLSVEITQSYYNQKRKCIAFVIENSNSLASVYALYQTLPNGMTFFNDSQDFLYYKAVADSLTNKYPNSIHVKTLLKDVEQFENRSNIHNLVNSKLIEDVKSPELIAKDMFGKEQKLSSLRGKTVLLYFWSVQSPNASLMNKELKDLYNTYSSKGFEIYQVSIDRSKQEWVNAITTQRLPWINVNDFLGESSPMIGLYNLSSVPTNYILDREGNIVGKNLWDNELVKKIQETL
ncbi:MAG: TlpA disulfide reductase family protein [Rikenellaceae bacterium]